MVDDRKRTEQVKVYFTERELLDLSRVAATEDRKLSELVHWVMRGFMYGKVSPRADCGEKCCGPSEGQQ